MCRSDAPFDARFHPTLPTFHRRIRWRRASADRCARRGRRAPLGDREAAVRWFLVGLLRNDERGDAAGSTVALPLMAAAVLTIAGPEPAATILGAYDALSRRYGIKMPRGMEEAVEMQDPRSAARGARPGHVRRRGTARCGDDAEGGRCVRHRDPPGGESGRGNGVSARLALCAQMSCLHAALTLVSVAVTGWLAARCRGRLMEATPGRPCAFVPAARSDTETMATSCLSSSGGSTANHSVQTPLGVFRRPSRCGGLVGWVGSWRR